MAGTSATLDPAETVATFARRFASARGRPLRALKVMTDAPAVVEAVRHIRALPTVCVCVSTEGAGAEIREVLSRRSVGIPTGRLAQAVLLLRGGVEDYLKGRHRQALRTNLNHARRLGITAARVCDSAAYLRGVERVLTVRGMSAEAVADLVERHRVTEGWTYLACSGEGAPLAFASWTADQECALLRVQMSAWSGRESTFARYALHMELVRDLVASGARCALAGSVLPLDDGHRYFQSLLGFETVNVRLDRLTTSADAQRNRHRPRTKRAVGDVGVRATPSLGW